MFVITDPFMEIIWNQIQSQGIFDYKCIIAYTYRYFGKVETRNPDANVFALYKAFENMGDILYFWEVERRLDPRQAALDSLTEYLEELFDAANNGSKDVTSYLRDLYISSPQYEDLTITQEQNLASLWKHLLENNYLSDSDEIEKEIKENSIFKLLSKSGQVAYKAALWQYKEATRDDYGICLYS